MVYARDHAAPIDNCLACAYIGAIPGLPPNLAGASRAATCYIQEIMSRQIARTGAILAVLLIFSFLIWALNLHGARGMLHMEPGALALPISLGILGAGILGFSIWQWPRSRTLSGRARWLVPPITLLTLAAITIPAFGFAFLGGFPGCGPGDTAPQLFLTPGVGSHGIPDLAVVLYTERAAEKSLTWGASDTIATIEGPASATQHIFLLQDLEPDTQYWYQVDGERYHFSTPGAGQRLSFAVGSDAHFGAGTNKKDLTEAMLAQIADPDHDLDYFFFLGDLVGYGFRRDQWREAVATMSTHLSGIPTGSVPGNHDTMFTGIDCFERYCWAGITASQEDCPLWYRVDIGNIHFLVLDVEWSAESFTPAQRSGWKNN